MTARLSLEPSSLDAILEYQSRFGGHLPANAASAAQRRAPAEEDASTGGSKRPRTTGRESSSFSAEEVQRRHKAWEDRILSPGLQAICEGRLRLPIMQHREEIMTKIHGGNFVLIAGETGCGKTTQVPQFILEDCWSRGQPCKILCTQPRRISAVSVAERVAAERGEKIGENVGRVPISCRLLICTRCPAGRSPPVCHCSAGCRYAIRLETRGGPSSSLMFQTNGVLLRMLTQGDRLQGVTHVVVDEIHERDRFADFLLILLRDLVREHRPDLKVILMSATMHIELFSGYFGGCPVVQVSPLGARMSPTGGPPSTPGFPLPLSFPAPRKRYLGSRTLSKTCTWRRCSRSQVTTRSTALPRRVATPPPSLPPTPPRRAAELTCALPRPANCSG